MEDDFDFEEFMENSNREWESKLNDWRERMILEAIELNYKKIKENGISDWHVRHMDKTEAAHLVETINYMMLHFEALEEYEKCAVLKKELSKLNLAMDKLNT